MTGTAGTAVTTAAALHEQRRLDWDGCLNVRDLGGLPTRDGRHTRTGAVVRADNLDRLTAEGQNSLLDYGVRTVVDLRDAVEYRPLLPAPDAVDLVRVPLDALAGSAWWARFGGLDGTPLSFRPYLDHCRDAVAELVHAVAVARPGAVVVHCGAGRDRTGLAALLLLALAGVEPAAIAEDYLLSAANLRPLWTILDRPDEEAGIARVLAAAGTTAEQAVHQVLAEFDAPDWLPADDVAAVRARLLT
ncbi:tyrosine-protein phosphatase [Kitasatospora cheerisanensis]|uniref:Putative tyrosine phosphatase n=1 Tax=Kitasatospora cheerisanensis KCTC 2395 TaxID=1348663 RepID=A0A066YTB8_9ACTN|nr:tyrosine-protein phosphatase [Kitasatospora cheerisanensis]KDN84497.1 putative tyrosine phosphatase [Kitasatospora cheerisanensis KCTC 2395]